jgi:hypothetical protein
LPTLGPQVPARDEKFEAHEEEAVSRQLSAYGQTGLYRLLGIRRRTWEQQRFRRCDKAIHF